MSAFIYDDRLKMTPVEFGSYVGPGRRNFSQNDVKSPKFTPVPGIS